MAGESLRSIASDFGVDSSTLCVALQGKTWKRVVKSKTPMRKHGPGPGEHNHAAKLKASDVLEIRRQLGLGTVQRKLAEKYGVSQTQISRIGLGKKWKYLAEEKPSAEPN